MTKWQHPSIPLYGFSNFENHSTITENYEPIEKEIEKKYKQREKKKKPKMKVSGKSVFTLAKILSEKPGQKALSLKKKKK